MHGVNVCERLLKFEEILGVKRTAHIHIKRHQTDSMRHGGDSTDQNELNAMLG